ncbi:hypothetical protein [Streptomyces sp. NBC_00212]|uniref:hypothetical protein n=1 Tax=Streptomyces sp. NBC_00212 TaxID=2975684 RepID=UPI0032447E10
MELPIDSWLYVTDEVAGCGVCTALAREVNGALKEGRHRSAFDASQEIRNHPAHGNPLASTAHMKAAT